MGHLSLVRPRISFFLSLFHLCKMLCLVLVSNINTKMMNVHVQYMFIGVHTIAVLRGSEDYTTLKEGFQPVLDEINELVESRLIEVQDTFYELEFFLGGDYKVQKQELRVITIIIKKM